MARMPLVFVGHGNPMNAIQNNVFTAMLEKLGQRLPRPKTIVTISAHWMSEGTWATAMPIPKTIHDFYGFPQALFDVQYPAPGSPETVAKLQAAVTDPRVNADVEMWGLDHGTWSVLKHMYPKADIPVVQLSLYMEQPPEYHFKIGQQLAKLRDQDVLIIGSGNLVHNLQRIDWETHAKAHDWAVEFDAWLKTKLEQRDTRALLNDFHSTPAGQLSIPSMDHWYPLYYVLGAMDSRDELNFDFEELHNASIAMRTFTFGGQS